MKGSVFTHVNITTTGKGRQAAAEDEVAATIILQGFLDAHVVTCKPRSPGQ